MTLALFASPIHENVVHLLISNFLSALQCINTSQNENTVRATEEIKSRTYTESSMSDFLAEEAASTE